MTAEPDALRLVPVEPTEAMIEAAANAPFSDARQATTNVYDRRMATVADMLRAGIAAAPSVQPAAGREEPVASGLTKAQRSLLFGIIRTGYGQKVEPWTKAHDALLDRGLIRINEYRIGFYKAYPTDIALALFGNSCDAALAHPPAQGSESGGEPVEYNPFRHDGFYVHEDGNRLCWMRDGTLSFWVPYEPASNAALSPQPGPASEGDGE